MAITSYRARRFGNLVRVTVTSDEVGTVYYHWYADGQYVGVTRSPTKTFYIDDGEQLRVVCVDTTSADYDPYQNPPDWYPARRVVWWVRSLSTDVRRYRVDQKAGAGDWETIALVDAQSGRWDYRVVTGRLDDLTDYAWRVIPLDAAGNPGTQIALDAERVVRTPDAPDYAIAFGDGTQKLTFSEAA